MKVVLDSNVIIAAFSTRGLCSDLFEFCILRYQIITSEHILAEVYRILHEKFNMPIDKVDAVIAYLRELCSTHPYEKPTSSICRDADDDEILALAGSVPAEYIITGDKDLLALGLFAGIPIISPRDFWKMARTKVE